jgi:hypothetical protein
MATIMIILGHCLGRVLCRPLRRLLRRVLWHTEAQTSLPALCTRPVVQLGSRLPIYAVAGAVGELGHLWQARRTQQLGVRFGLRLQSGCCTGRWHGGQALC